MLPQLESKRHCRRNWDADSVRCCVWMVADCQVPGERACKHANMTRGKRFDRLVSGILFQGASPCGPKRVTVAEGRHLATVDGEDLDVDLASVVDTLIPMRVEIAGHFDKYNAQLERRIAERAEETLRQKPDVAAPTPPMELLSYYWAPQGLTPMEWATDRVSWGIFLTTGGCEVLATSLLASGISRDDALKGSIAALYLHELFHHLVAASAALLEEREQKPTYEDFRRRTDARLTYNPLEEALANAFMLRHLSPQLHQRLLPFVRSQPPGYDKAELYTDDRAFSDGVEELLAQMLDVNSSDLELSDIRLFDLHAEDTGPGTVSLHMVESRDSAHAAGEWRWL